MDIDRITAVMHLHKTNSRIDINIPLDITAHELILGLNQAYKLGINTNDLSCCVLRSENPIALLKGKKTLAEYGLRNGTVINIV